MFWGRASLERARLLARRAGRLQAAAVFLVQPRKRDTAQRNRRSTRADEVGKMGKVMVKVKLSNSYDLENSRRGLIPPEEVRAVEIEALVDTGATMLVLPGPVVERLGVPVLRYNDVRYANGHSARVARVGDIRFEVLGRDMTCDALVEPDGHLALIGLIQLEALDLIVDPKSRELRVNPESPDTETLDLYAVARVMQARTPRTPHAHDSVMSVNGR